MQIELSKEVEARLRKEAERRKLEPDQIDRWIAGQVEEILRAVMAGGYHPGMLAGAKFLDGAEDPDAPYSLLELEGLGAELWKGRDAQAYVNELRDDWDRLP